MRGFLCFLDIGPIGRLAYSQSKNPYNNKRCSTRSSNINSYSTIISRKCKKNMKKANFTKSVHRINPLYNRLYLRRCSRGMVDIFWFLVYIWSLLASYIVDFIFAYTLGIGFQYFSIIPMRKMMEGKQLSKKEGVTEAVKADTLSLIIYEKGLFIWMGLTQLVFFSPKLEPTLIGS